MSIKLKESYCSAPNTERGRSASFDVSPDGKTMIFGSGSNIVIKDLENPLKVELYSGHKNKVTVAKISPNGNYICSGDDGGHIIVWSLDNEDHTTQLQSHALSSSIRDVSWTFDNQRIAVVGEGKKSFAHVFIWNTGTSIGAIDGHSKMILSVDFKPNRPFRVATASEDNKSNFYLGPPFKFDSSNSGHSNYVNCVRYAPDGKNYVTVGSDKKMIIYEGKTGKETGKFDAGHKGTIYQLSWSPKGDELLTCSADKTCKLWNFAEKKVVETFTFQDKELDFMQVGVHWSKKTNKAYSLSLNGSINELDFKNPKEPKTIAGHNSVITKIIYDGSKYFYSCGSGGKLIQWELGTENNKVVAGKKMFHKKQIGVIVASIDGKHLIVGSDDSTIRFVPTDTFKYAGKSDDIKVSGVPCDGQLNKDGSLAFIATHRGISIIDVKQQSEVSFTSLDFEPLSVSVNHSNDEIAIAGDNKKIYIFTQKDGKLDSKPKNVISGHKGQVQAIRFSPDGKLLAAGDKFREIIVYDSSDYSPKYTQLLYHTGAVTDLDWTSDSKYLVSCSLDKSAIVWDLPNKSHIKEFTHFQGVRCIATIDGSSFLTAGSDNGIASWNFTQEVKK